MFIELLDLLRCVRPHEDSWLVGSFDELVDRHIIRGTLGCPVCGAEYPVRGGVVDFRLTGNHREATGIGFPAGQANARAERATDGSAPPDDAAVMRLAALLGLAESGGVVILTGQWAASGPGIEALVPGLQQILVNPGAPVFPFASAVRTDEVLPLASGAARAVALDATASDTPGVAEAARVLRAGGRLLAPVEEAVPPGVAELARDDVQWVGEREVASGPILSLTRRK